VSSSRRLSSVRRVAADRRPPGATRAREAGVRADWKAKRPGPAPDPPGRRPDRTGNNPRNRLGEGLAERDPRGRARLLPVGRDTTAPHPGSANRPGLGAPSAGASDTNSGPGSSNTLPRAPTWCPRTRQGDRGPELGRPASGTRTGWPGRSRPAAHTSPRDPRSCVLPWSRRRVSRVPDPAGTPKAPLIPTVSTRTITQRRPRNQETPAGHTQSGSAAPLLRRDF
jgi:hypothetical protein